MRRKLINVSISILFIGLILSLGVSLLNFFVVPEQITTLSFDHIVQKKYQANYNNYFQWLRQSKELRDLELTLNKNGKRYAKTDSATQNAINNNLATWSNKQYQYPFSNNTYNPDTGALKQINQTRRLVGYLRHQIDKNGFNTPVVNGLTIYSKIWSSGGAMTEHMQNSVPAMALLHEIRNVIKHNTVPPEQKKKIVKPLRTLANPDLPLISMATLQFKQTKEKVNNWPDKQSNYPSFLPFYNHKGFMNTIATEYRKKYRQLSTPTYTNRKKQKYTPGMVVLINNISSPAGVYGEALAQTFVSNFIREYSRSIARVRTYSGCLLTHIHDKKYKNYLGQKEGTLTESCINQFNWSKKGAAYSRHQ